MLEFVGSNPCIVLYDSFGRVSAGASYWDADYTPVGPGQVLFLLDRSTEDGRSRVTAYAADRNLAKYLWDFNQHFVGFEKNRLVTSNETPTFCLDRQREGATLTCDVAERSVLLKWTKLVAPISGGGELHNFGQKSGRSYRVRSTVIPAKSGSISVDGRPLGGTTKSDYGELPTSSFLAWSETWERIHS